MEKNTVLAIVCSAVVILGWLILQPILYPPHEQAPNKNAAEASPVVPAAEAPGTANTAGATDGAAASGETGAAPLPGLQADNGGAKPADIQAQIEADVAGLMEEPERRIIIETDLIQATLTSSGGDMISYRLKQHNDKNEMVQMILPAEDGEAAVESRAFTTAFGGLEAKPVKAAFKVFQPSPLIVEFSRNFSLTGYPGFFTMIKRYEFKNNEYMFQLAVSIQNDSGAALDFNDAAYTLSYGPQMGPHFQKLNMYNEYRNYYTMVNGKRSNVKVNTVNDSRFTWAAIAGKYFTAIAIPDNTLYSLSFSDKAEPGIPIASRLSLIRPSINNSSVNDVFYFYLGPKTQENLGRYDTGDNGFKLRDLELSKAASTSGFLTPLEKLLKWLLQLCYMITHNYGAAIILLTLLVKILLFPLTKKSSEASFKMQALAPKIKELQAKYKDNPQKMNLEMGAVYKKAGTSPLSGCLPMLIQMPLLFAMYNLFNNHFDLRGAMFIPGWIPDLSLPESIMNFDTPVPMLGWEALRLLPFIYVGSQILYGFATRTPEQQSNPTMKMMTYVLPITFFFVLYNVPSGLLIFWIMSNLFTLVQQVILNKYMAKKKAEEAAAAANEPAPIIAPRRKKKR
jgi:YidC/Oxa1 family membrane protein insertase